MGATGYRPDEDDDYHDLFAQVSKPIDAVLRRKVTPLSIYRYAAQWRAAAQFLLVMAPLYGASELARLLELAVGKLDALAKNDVYLEMWDDPKAARRALIEERDAFVAASEDLMPEGGD